MRIDSKIRGMKLWGNVVALQRVLEYCLLVEQGERPTAYAMSKRWMIQRMQGCRIIRTAENLMRAGVIVVDNSNTNSNTDSNKVSNKKMRNTDDIQGDRRNTNSNTDSNTNSNNYPSPLDSPLKREEEKESSKEKEEDKIYPPIIPPTPSNNIIVVETKTRAREKELVDARRERFKEGLGRYVGRYGKEMCNEFYMYWTELNKSGTKMRWELEKTWDLGRRLARWANNNRGFGVRSVPAVPVDEDRKKPTRAMKEMRALKEWERRKAAGEDVPSIDTREDFERWMEMVDG